ncbi:hypothetical protein [Pseudoprimorskyibacter insulae]|uniref:Uncharacterized protein n=1 Tax=Pseudoprimorskyibacter insulae TaxID=1695997 RepID=A0A2R8AQB2_9RHOB|nr:hypothetical protein [Pseudoprimorskyibacter insulae]SPF78024.1 hypothetical protein PRI8871_00613 [Pseudoprimorskyibacter insulae]
MFRQSQINQFNTQGYLGIENTLSPDVLTAVKAEYQGLIDGLYAEWQANSNVPPADAARAHSPQARELREWPVWKTLRDVARTRLAPQNHISIHCWTSVPPVCA